MKAVVYEAPRKFEYRDVDIPRIQSDEVLIRVDACGLCGTDLHIHEGEFAPRFPLIPGHEFTGEITDLGSEVTGFKNGLLRRLDRETSRIIYFFAASEIFLNAFTAPTTAVSTGNRSILEAPTKPCAVVRSRT